MQFFELAINKCEVNIKDGVQFQFFTSIKQNLVMISFFHHQCYLRSIFLTEYLIGEKTWVLLTWVKLLLEEKN